MAEVKCPKCGKDVWDNREGKKNPKAPDYKCKDRACEGAIWPERKPAASSQRQAAEVHVPDYLYDQEAHESTVVRNIVKGGDDAALQSIFALQDQCFAHALKLARSAADVGLEADVSALCAQAMIAYQKR